MLMINKRKMIKKEQRTGANTRSITKYQAKTTKQTKERERKKYMHI